MYRIYENIRNFGMGLTWGWLISWVFFTSIFWAGASLREGEWSSWDNWRKTAGIFFPVAGMLGVFSGYVTFEKYKITRR